MREHLRLIRRLLARRPFLDALDLGLRRLDGVLVFVF